MCGEFAEIFKLCHEILEMALKPSLIKATLETLLRFLNWIPLGYIFETNLIEILKTRVKRIRAWVGNFYYHLLILRLTLLLLFIAIIISLSFCLFISRIFNPPSVLGNGHV